MQKLGIEDHREIQGRSKENQFITGELEKIILGQVGEEGEEEDDDD